MTVNTNEVKTAVKVVDNLITELQTKLQKAEEEISDLKHKIGILEEVKNMFPASDPEIVVIDKDIKEVTANDFRGMDLRQAIINYARINNGIFNSYHARPMLTDAGVLTGEPAHVSQKLYETLDKMPEFTNEERRGHWRMSE